MNGSLFQSMSLVVVTDYESTFDKKLYLMFPKRFFALKAIIID